MTTRSPAGRAKQPRHTTGTPAARSRKVDVPVRQQDGTALSVAIADAIAETQTLPLDGRVDDLEQTVATLSARAIYEAELTLRAGGRSGRLFLDGEFLEPDIGQPVLMVQAASDEGDEAEAGIVQFVARIVDRRRMRVMWSSAFPAPRQVRVVYQILTRDVSGRLAALWSAQPAHAFLAGPSSGADGAPTFRSMMLADLPADVGTVRSVGLSVPAEFTVFGSPVTGLGTLGATWANQAANVILAGPVTGAAGPPVFRALVAADIPAATPAAHQLDGALHTVSGLSPGQFLKALTADTFGFAVHGLGYGDVGAAAANHGHLWTDVSKTGSNLTDLVTRQHGGLTDVTADQHHAEIHVLDGALHTVSGLTGGHFLKATGATTFAFAAHGLSYGDVGAAPANHSILSATHGDSTAAVVVRGDLVVGIGASPKWERLAKGTAGYFLKATADDAVWAAHGLTYSDVGALAAGATAVDSDKLDGQHGSYYAVAGAAPAAHQLDGALHTVSGLTTGHFLKATGATTFAFGAHGLAYGDVGAAPLSHAHAWADITSGVPTTWTPIAHDILSAYHGDSTAAAVVRGDLIIGSGATPKWTRLAIGTAGYLLKAGANEPAWGTLASTDLSDTANLVRLGAANSFTLINPLTTLAESWIGPSSTAGIYFKDGNVSIGTTISNTLVTLAKNAGISLDTLVTADDGVLALFGCGGADSSRGASIILYGVNHATSPGDLRLTAANAPGMIKLVTAGQDRVIVLNDGKFALGSSLPYANFHVAQNVGTTAPSTTFHAAGPWALEVSGVELVGGVAPDSPFPYWLQARHVSNSPWGIALNPVGGNVGVGTVTAAAKVAINGGLHVGGDSDPGDNNLLVDGNIKVSEYLQMGAGWWFGWEGRCHMESFADGYMNLYTSAGNAAGGLIFGPATASYVQLLNDTNAGFKIIGGDGMAAKNLEVTGTTKLDTLGAFAVGDKYVIADASGNLHVSTLGPLA